MFHISKNLKNPKLTYCRLPCRENLGRKFLSWWWTIKICEQIVHAVRSWEKFRQTVQNWKNLIPNDMKKNKKKTMVYDKNYNNMNNTTYNV